MTDTQKRIYSFWGDIFVAYVLPLIILSFKYKLFSKYTASGTKWSIWLIIGLLFLIIRLWKELQKFVKNMSYTWFRDIILGIMSISPWLLLLGSTFLISYFATDYIFIIRTITLCAIGSIPLNVIHSHYDIKRRLDRGDVRVINK